MSFLNCPDCGRLFRGENQSLCPACEKVDEEEYRLVRNFIRDHAGLNILDISEATGVRVDKIIRFLRNGKFITRQPAD